MRIAFFTDTFYPQVNGVSNTLSYLSRYLQARKIEHVFFAPDYGFDSDECAGLPVTRFKGFCPIIYPECRIAFAPLEKITGLLADFAPDVVHIVTELSMGLVGLRAAEALGIPVVMSYHTNFDKYLHFYHLTYFSQALWHYMKWFHSFALVNLCPSRDTLESMKRRGFKNLGIWSRGIDLDRFSPSHFSSELRERLGARGKTVFLYVGRVSVEKGLDVLMQSIRGVNETHGDRVQFWITGDGPFLKEIASLKLPNVVFTGEKRGAELAQVYAGADAFVFPSGTETFGNVLLEAMASGLAPICTDSGGVTDYTVHGENALVCRYGDSGSLSRAILDLLDPQLRGRIRQQALQTAKSRSWDSIFDSLMLHYGSAALSLPARRQADIHKS
ncbi:MAG: glycosyltransferase family 4 protein [bacterium]